ncbi:MAG: ATP-binding protein [Victivallales bacterium]|nr:ATP-binding protein [Victivallales bacterium]
MDLNENFAAKAEKCFIRVIAGAQKGKIIAAPGPDFTFGRALEADIYIKDKLISRRHCRLVFVDGKWYIEDLGSTNGTWVMGQKIEKKVVLPFRTSVRIGRSIFEILMPGAATKTSPLDVERITCNIPLLDFCDEQECGTSSHAAMSLRPNRMLELFVFQNSISFVLEPIELYHRIIDGLRRILPLTAAYVLVFDLESGKFVTVSGWRDDFLEDGAEAVDKSIVSYVQENYQSVIVRGVAPSPGVRRSVMCVPMLTREHSNGMLYVCLDDAEKEYGEDDLWLLTVAGHTAGMTLQHRNMLEFNFRNERMVATGTSAAEISHYIKNILAAMEGSFSLMQMGIDDKDIELTAEAFGIIKRNHLRLGNVVLNLLNLASEQKLNVKVSDLGKVIRDIVELVGPNLKNDGIDFDVDLASLAKPICVEMDANGIYRVLLNLVNNAEHAVLQKKTKIDQQNVGTVRLRTEIDADRSHVRVWVEDDGIGISPEEAKRMFDLFITSKGAAGTGLGLAVSRRIIEAHGGKLFAEGEKGKRCRLTFVLPLVHNDNSTNTCAISI